MSATGGTLRGSGKGGSQRFWERPDVEAALDGIGDVGNHFALGKTQFVTVRKHLDKATADMRKGRTERERRERNRHADDTDVNAGLNTRSGLRAPEPKLPSNSMVPRAAGKDSGTPKVQRSVT
jgi:hypothetical protein